MLLTTDTHSKSSAGYWMAMCNIGFTGRPKSDSGGNVWLIKTFSSDAGYNMISSEFTRVNGELIDRRGMEYQSAQGIYVPSKATYESFDPADGSLQYRKTRTFKNVRLNHAIPAEVFSYKNLGLEDGDDFEDRILDKKYVYKQGELVEVPKPK